MDSEAKKTDSFYEFLAWVHVNTKKILVVAAGLALVISVVAIVVWNKGHQEDEANKALSEIRLLGGAASPIKPGTAEALLKVANTYPTTAAGARALLLAATTLFDEGKYSEAKELFEKFSRAYPDSPWRAQAELGVAVCLDSPKQSQAAADKYDEIIKRYASEASADLARLELARWQEQQGKFEAAFRLYTELTKANQYSSLGSEAGVQKQQLLEKHPELEQTNTVIVPKLTTALTMPTNATNVAKSNAMVLTITNPVAPKTPEAPKK